MTGIAELDGAIRATEYWVDDLRQRLGWHDRSRSLTVLLAALHGVRDSLPRNEAIFLGAQLPPLLRGLYYEGWHPGPHAAGKSRAALLDRIHDSVHRDPGVDAEQVAHAVFALLAARLPPAELEDAKAATPATLHGLWPS
ncbi:MAG: DUF2267 domain-containing protein [Alphaproteobacteria bacterium]|nr:DUF2267 domain-containing protein [Alphaproteobacteria bacterium]